MSKLKRQAPFVRDDLGISNQPTLRQDHRGHTDTPRNPHNTHIQREPSKVVNISEDCTT